MTVDTEDAPSFELSRKRFPPKREAFHFDSRDEYSP